VTAPCLKVSGNSYLTPSRTRCFRQSVLSKISHSETLGTRKRLRGTLSFSNRWANKLRAWSITRSSFSRPRSIRKLIGSFRTCSRRLCRFLLQTQPRPLS
jgi:hypothetical protein